MSGAGMFRSWPSVVLTLLAGVAVWAILAGVFLAVFEVGR